MIKAGSNSLNGLPLADRDVAGMVAYRDLEFGGWDLTEDSLGACALRHGVGESLDPARLTLDSVVLLASELVAHEQGGEAAHEAA